MSSESSSKNSGLIVVFAMAIFVVGMTAGVAITGAILQEDERTTYQGALNISNWTNRTLNITVFVYANDWTTFQVALNHTDNVTLFVTWAGVNETVTFIHSVGPGVYNTVMYTLEAGQWRSILLV